MEVDQIKLPAEVAKRYEVVKPIRQLIIQKPKKNKIVLERCSLDQAKILAEKGYLKEKASGAVSTSASNKDK